MKADVFDMVVVGLGPSVRAFLPAARDYLTMGVNDVGRWFTPDHLLVLDQERRFSPERAAVIRNTRPGVGIWYHNPWPGWTDCPEEPRKVRIRVTRCPREKYGRTLHSLRSDGIGELSRIPHYRTSPFCAASLAFILGATRIGLVGVDMVNHPLAESRRAIDEEFFHLASGMAEHGVQLVNLSALSTLSLLRREPLEFIRTRQ